MPDEKPACESGMTHACNPSTHELEAEQSGGQGQPRLCSSLGTSLGYMTPCLQKKRASKLLVA